MAGVVLVIAHNAGFDRGFLERRLPAFVTKHWACSLSDIDWRAEGLRSSALEFIAYALGFFHDGHRPRVIVWPWRLRTPSVWFRDVPDAEKLAEVAWLRANVIDPDQDVWALPITAKDRYLRHHRRCDVRRPSDRLSR